MDKNLISYLPPLLQNILEYQKICTAQQAELLLCESAVQSVLEGQFIDSADVDSIARYESIMSIVPRGTDTIEDRRFRIKNRIMGDSPYTKVTLNQKLAALCGENGFSVTIDHATYTITIKLELTAKNQMDEVKRTLADMIPANMLSNVSIRYNQHYKLIPFTHAQLAENTHKQIRNEVL